MSETREQFRERIADAGWEGMKHSEFEEGAIGHLIDGFEAVYAQALRDVLDHMDLRFVVVGIDERDGNVRTAIDAIEAFADERGIDLSE